MISVNFSFLLGVFTILDAVVGQGKRENSILWSAFGLAFAGLAVPWALWDLATVLRLGMLPIMPLYAIPVVGRSVLELGAAGLLITSAVRRFRAQPPGLTRLKWVIGGGNVALAGLAVYVAFVA